MGKGSVGDIRVEERTINHKGWFLYSSGCDFKMEALDAALRTNTWALAANVAETLK